MVMTDQIQFEDMFVGSYVNPQGLKINFDDELDMFLGISPIPKSMQDDFSDEQNTHSEMTRKHSIKTESLETQHHEQPSETNIDEEEVQNKKSNHHNFQKHTVTALRDLVKQNKFQNFCQDSSLAKITQRLWKEFLQIKGKSIMTKKFLSILFRNDLQSVTLLKPYGFKQLFEQYKQSQILAAKNELRRLVIIFMNDKQIQEHVDKREIKRKEEFRLYLINFRRELENTNIKKRISKQSSDWISVNAEVFDCLN